MWLCCFISDHCLWKMLDSFKCTLLIEVRFTVVWLWSVCNLVRCESLWRLCLMLEQMSFWTCDWPTDLQVSFKYITVQLSSSICPFSNLPQESHPFIFSPIHPSVHCCHALTHLSSHSHMFICPLCPRFSYVWFCLFACSRAQSQIKPDLECTTLRQSPNAV